MGWIQPDFPVKLPSPYSISHCICVCFFPIQVPMIPSKGSDLTQKMPTCTTVLTQAERQGKDHDSHLFAEGAFHLQIKSPSINRRLLP